MLLKNVSVDREIVEKVWNSFKNNSKDLSITDIVSQTGISRSAIRIILAQLEGAELVSIRRVGMAKLYKIKNEKTE